MNTQVKKELPILAAALVPVIYTAIMWTQLPENIPTHWNMHGEIDDWGPKYLAFVLPLGLYAMLALLPLIDPRRKEKEQQSFLLFRLRLGLQLFFSVISMMMVFAGLGMDVKMERVIASGIFILFIFIGNYMANIQPNWLIGIRVPWTLKNDEVWRKTHRLGSKIWFYGGLTGLLISFFLTKGGLAIFLFSSIGLMTIIPIVYSYLEYKKIKN